MVSSSGAAAGFPTPGGQWGAASGAPGFTGGNAGSAPSGGGGAPDGNGAGAGGNTMAMLERMMTDDNLQKMLYPYLPEPMRNPETFKWMLSNPEYRQQLEAMMAQQARAVFLPSPLISFPFLAFSVPARPSPVVCV